MTPHPSHNTDTEYTDLAEYLIVIDAELSTRKVVDHIRGIKNAIARITVLKEQFNLVTMERFK